MSIIIHEHKAGFCRMPSIVIWDYDRKEVNIDFLAEDFVFGFVCVCV